MFGWGVKAFRQKGLLFPRRLKKGPNKGDLGAELPHSRHSSQSALYGCVPACAAA